MTTRRDIPNSYGEAARLLNGVTTNSGRRRDRLTVANNTVIEREHCGHDEDGKPRPDVFSLSLHGHTLVTWHFDGGVVLDSCGYRTVTTKDRLNRAQRVCRVYQRDYRWYYVTRLPSAPDVWTWSNPHIFVDGLALVDEAQAITAWYARASDPSGPTGGDTGD